MRLKEKISIITGGASGFGRGIAKKFSEEGSKLILADINEDLLEKVSKDLNQDFFYTDVASSSSMQELSKYVLKKYGTIDIMVNNAFITHLPKPLEQVSEEEFDKIFAKSNEKSVIVSKWLDRYRELILYLQGRRNIIRRTRGNVLTTFEDFPFSISKIGQNLIELKKASSQSL